MRTACFYIPLFPLAARLRSEPELREEAVAILEGNGNAAHVIAASRRARGHGIRAGLSLPQARAILPRLIARGRDADCERAAREALFEVAERFSPRVESSGEGFVHLDIDGVELHYRNGDGSPEEALAHAALRAGTAVALPLRVGIASSKLASRVAAELPHTPTIVPPGDEAKFLAPLPLSRLAPEIEIAGTLTRWGIESIGQFAQLSEGEVATRLGEIGRALHYAARGIDPHPIIPRQPPHVFEEGMELEWPIVSIEPFLFVASATLDRLARRLESSGYACTRLELNLELEPDGHHCRTLQLPAPTRDTKTMLTLIRLDLEGSPPGAPIAGFQLVAHPDKPRRAQLSLFGPPALSPDKVAAMVARVASIVGADRAGSPAPLDSHLPGRFTMTSFDPPPPPETRRAPKKGKGLLSTRALRPPVPLEVIVEGSESRADEWRLVSMKAASSPLAIDGSIKVASGPWRLEEGWWIDSPVDRDYWDVEFWSGGLYRIYRERAKGGWFVDGVYD